MKPQAVYPLAFLVIACAMFFVSTSRAIAQEVPNPGQTNPAISDTVKGSPSEKIIKFNADSTNKEIPIKSVDSTKYDMFGNLLNDDPLFNKKLPLWRPIFGVIQQNAVLGLFNRYVTNADFSKVGFNTWRHNIKTGWVWDTDRFGMNFLAHPYSGGSYLITGRASGYSFWQSLPFSVGGSLEWEYLGENTLPSYNDLINTSIAGAFYGEILYRLGSIVLDDRKTGIERVAREAGAGIMSPTRLWNRFVQGKLWRVTPEEVYQKAPLNLELSAGARRVNNGHMFGTGPSNLLLSTQFDYGYPFEKRFRKPFDYFTVRAGSNWGVGRKIVENVTGYGILYGKNGQSGKLETLTGFFQHYNYFDNTTFELGTIALGGGIMSKYPVSKDQWIFTNFHVGVVPLAGNSSRFGPDTSQVRDYNYGGGAQALIESGLNLGWGSFQFNGFYYWIHTYVGAKGNNFIGIIKPRITVRLVRNLNVGYEQMVYYNDRYTQDFGSFHNVRTEQRAYLMLNVGNFKL